MVNDMASLSWRWREGDLKKVVIEQVKDRLCQEKRSCVLQRDRPQGKGFEHWGSRGKTVAGGLENRSSNIAGGGAHNDRGKEISQSEIRLSGLQGGARKKESTPKKGST